MPTVQLPRTRERFGSGVVVSALVHGGIVLALVVGAASSGEAFRELGGGGATVVRYVELLPTAADRSAASALEPPTADPPPRRSLPRPDLEVVSPAVPALSLTTITRPEVGLRAGTTGSGRGAGPGTGGGVGSGRGPGVGVGTGPGVGSGGGAGFPPAPRFIIVPADRPASVRGKRFDVHFWVDDRGRVTRVEVDPPIDDAGYRRKFLDQMRQFLFDPARTTDGRPVSGQVVIPITL